MMEYWQKQDKSPYMDLLWNLPEQKTGTLLVVGGNSQNFNSSIRISEFLINNFPIQNVKTVLPDAIKNKLPALENFVFLPSTNTGSFAESQTFESLATTDYTILLGDLSKNSTTQQTVIKMIKGSQAPLIITRDAVDFILDDALSFINQDNLIFIASMAQIQKLFRAVYYPKVILLSMPLMQIVENLHKFTLSYPCFILTFHDGQIIIAKNGQIITVPIEKTSYSPLSLWSGQLAAKIAAINLFNPNHLTESASAAIFE